MADENLIQDERIKSFLAYLFGIISGIIILIIEKQSKYVRFNALQSIYFSLATIVLTAVFSFSKVLSVIVSLAIFIIWIVLLVMSFQGKKYKLPFIGDLAEKQA